MEEKFLKLTNAVYKVLEFFPESDPLKNRAKDRALAIMDGLGLVYGTDGWASFQTERAKINILEDIDMLLGYFWIAKSQGWLSAVNCLIICHEYEKIKKEIESKIELAKRIPQMEAQVIADPAPKTERAPRIAASTAEPTIDQQLSDRQKKIIDYLGKNEKAQVMDLQTVLPDITKRTIRRDLDELLTNGKIVRLGDFNQVFYKLTEWSDKINQ